MIEQELYFAADEFLKNLFSELDKNNIELQDHWDIDHLCYRTDDFSRYLILKEEFKNYGKLLIASEVNGREISTYELFKPICFRDKKVFLIELPAPKIGKITQEGFEHAEVVCDISFEILVNKYGHLKQKAQGLKKIFNQELEINMGLYNLKFHHLSLMSVINLEKNTKVWTAVLDSNILEIFSEQAPLICGDFLLNVYVENSEMVILLKSANLEETKNKLINCFENVSEFLLSCTLIDGRSCIVCNFNFDNLAFKIFVQDRDPVRQTEYLNFLIAERLFKLGGQEFKDKIFKKRKNGTKISETIIKVLGIAGDPNLKILEMQKSPTMELSKLLSTFIY